MKEPKKEKIKRLHLQLASERGLEKTYCPSEVARKFEPENWREHMHAVRKAADEPIVENKLEVLQKGKVIKEKASQVTGAIRLRKK